MPKSSLATKIVKQPKVGRAKIVFCLLICMYSYQGYPQMNWKYIDNSRIKFNILRYSMKWTANNSITPVMYLIDVKIPARFKNKFKQLDKDKLLKLLINEDTDWTTNLLLYDIFEKDATFLWEINRNEWTLEGKAKDIDYWQSVLR